MKAPVQSYCYCAVDPNAIYDVSLTEFDPCPV